MSRWRVDHPRLRLDFPHGAARHGGASMGRKWSSSVLIVGLWRYPVASLGGEGRSVLELRPEGPGGDRVFVVMRVSDKTVAAPEANRAWSSAPSIEARGDPVEIRVPGGDWLPARDPRTSSVLSSHFGFEVELRPARPFNRPDVAGDGACVRAPRQPLHVMTTRQLDELQAALPGSCIHVARSRPNVLVDASLEECERLDRSPCVIQGDDCRIEIVEKTLRCGFPALAQGRLSRDGQIVKHLRKDYDLKFGFGARIAGTGSLRNGEVLRLVQEEAT